MDRLAAAAQAQESVELGRILTKGRKHANVDLVRSAYLEGWIDRDPARLLAFADDQICWINPADAVEPGVRHGSDDVLDTLAGVRAAFDSAIHELRDLFDADDSVVAAVTFRARGRTSNLEVAQEECHTWTFRDGKIVSIEWGRDLAAALVAVGLEE